MKNKNLIKCHYCKLEKPAQVIFYYPSKDGKNRPICPSCKTSGRYWIKEGQK